MIRRRLVRVADVLRLANPLEKPPWLCPPGKPVDPISFKDIEDAWGSCVVGAEVHHPVCPHLLPSKEDHCRRIAHLARFGWSGAIDFDIPSFQQGVWPLFDGNHRVAAAAFRKDELILADVYGEPDQIVSLFGAECA